MKPFKRISVSEKDKRAEVAVDPELLAAASAMSKGKHSSEGTAMLQAASPSEAVGSGGGQSTGGGESSSSITATLPVMHAVGTILEVPVDELIDNPWNARRRAATGAQLDKRSKSLKAQGQLVPAKAYQDEAGRIRLVDGHRRKYSAKNGGIPTLRVELCAPPADLRDLYLQSRAANVERETQSPLDDALSWQALLAQNIFSSQVELANVLDMSEATVSRHLALLKIPTKVIEIINSREDPAQFETLRMLDALRLYFEAMGQEATEELVLEIARDGLSARDVDARRTQKPREKVTRERSDIMIQKFAKGHATVRQFETGRRVLLEVAEVEGTISLEKISEALNKTLKEILGEH